MYSKGQATFNAMYSDGVNMSGVQKIGALFDGAQKIFAKIW